jgi:hypothetical protein
MYYHLNTQKQRIEITAHCGYVIAFIDYCHFGKGYGYFAALLDDVIF